VDACSPSEADGRQEVDATNRLVVVLGGGLSALATNTAKELTSSMPNIEVIRQVRLNAHLRPITSTRRPKPSAPMLNAVSM
jgi:hypothetical protein